MTRTEVFSRPGMVRVIAAILPIFFLCMTSPASAREFFDGKVIVNAYGTLGVAMGSDSDTEMFRSIARHGPSLSKDLSTNYDSRVGAQLEFHVHEKVNLVWQGLLHRNLDDATRVDTKWAYLQVQPTDWLDLKLGRYLLPLYLISDQLYVGYAHPWARPPQEVYGLPDEVDHADGALAEFRWFAGETGFSLELSAGKFDDKVGPADTPTEVRPRTASLSVSRGNLTVRAMVAKGPTRLDVSPALNAFLNAGSRYRYDVTGEDDVHYYNLGFIYEDAEWLATGEVLEATFDDNHVFSDMRNYSLTVGRRFGDFLPFVAYSGSQVLNDDNETPAAFFPVQNGLINARKHSQNTASLGVRWDFHPGYALKFQADTTRVRHNETGQFTPAPRGNVRTYTAVLDWVW